MRTIENSVVVPVFVIICLALAGLAVFSCNTVVSRSRAFRKVIDHQYGDLSDGTEKTARESLKREIKDQSIMFDPGDIGFDHKSGNLLKGEEIELSIEGRSAMKIPLFAGFNEFKYRKSFKLISPSYDLRKYNCLVKGTKGVINGTIRDKK
ncbi:MAG: hypothetical protein KHZ87_00335 [Clostridiales bacterium]|nr:hypothetical protein [Clostridiales bacterium]MBS5877593.1 hypothetical protein [Clostridiales bacterium]MDU0939796.1 hypothetical protein [Clostridiales bacterium]MDU1042054.1 hypothetical protein [Clostridiales bacterium]MDU3490274.1 hypothetical protein [Clostridiales bacterium]